MDLAIALLVLSPADAVSDQPVHRVNRVGFVGITSATNREQGFLAFRDYLKQLGYVDGRNLLMETRWADGQIDHLPSLMSDVVRRNVDVIVTAGTPAAFAAKKATDTIPIVAMFMADPLRTGLVKSLAHPEGNLTGTS